MQSKAKKVAGGLQSAVGRGGRGGRRAGGGGGGNRDEGYASVKMMHGRCEVRQRICRCKCSHSFGIIIIDDLPTIKKHHVNKYTITP